MKITLDEIHIFVTIVDTGSLTKAADQLGQPLSSLSRSLGRLESKLDVSLFRRTTRRIDLTEEGERFLSNAREILHQIEVAEDSVKDKAQAPSGLIRVDSASPFVLHSIVPVMNEFKSLYPDISFEIHSHDRIIDLLEKRIDVAIRIGTLEDSTLRAAHLGTSRLRILASPGYLNKHGIPKKVEDLAKHHLLGFTAPRELNQWPLKTKHGNYSVESPCIAASSGETLLQLAKSGLGITCLSDFMTQQERSSGELVQILKSHTMDVRQDIHAVYYKNLNPSRRTTLFVQFLKEKLKPILKNSFSDS
ncbi:LysR family transcriptional regulator [Bdellovibrio bacteriovorus]|uniref:LysR family transcriptional regulator n=1 Tax=Bdellovibrio bacteriovorus TaxID=959 RepID=UPI0021D11356|nr:LysR family transcriptional regulator [Bdellovibrio bacteriovorus]UXR66087.1 LysR family transcriptional regulator [Bdellovibrio bacteriovorus]